VKHVLILGATSGIAESFAHSVMKQFPEAKLCLVSRSAAKLESIRADIGARFGLAPYVMAADLNEFSGARALVENCAGQLETTHFDTVLIAHGFMENEEVAQADFTRALPVIATNYVGPVALCSALVPYLKEGSTLAVITSVAGDRGRPSNFVYGSAKAGLQAYLSGLNAKLFSKKIGVLDVRPGFTKTAMTAHLNRSGPLWATPDHVAADILRAVQRRRSVLYTPWFWCGIMAIIRAIPGFVFRRLKL